MKSTIIVPIPFWREAASVSLRDRGLLLIPRGKFRRKFGDRFTLREHLPNYILAVLNIAGDQFRDPKEITLIGSGRIGYSLAPSEYGRPFGPERDLDFSVISDLLFSRMKEAFERWKIAVESGLRPRSGAEERYWPENLDRLPRNIERGFVDAYKIPNWYQDPNIVDIMSQLSRKLAVTPACPAFSGAHVRVFRDWPAFVRQAELNLESICRRLANHGI